jgi:hypothetical protein
LGVQQPKTVSAFQNIWSRWVELGNLCDFAKEVFESIFRDTGNTFYGIQKSRKSDGRRAMDYKVIVNHTKLCQEP